ncbi:MAG TPA: DUF2283 domain-containing protein [Gemmatimonadaceae bacterium]|jgi:uncharacterized protein YuzE|nr:DUF2283 domain-containing protein [Gemmatimonadaceae bacterium]
MMIKYFRDTDTALLEFSDAPVEETRELSAHVYADLDADGNLVSLTIEHAAHVARLPEVTIQEFGADAA